MNAKVLLTALFILAASFGFSSSAFSQQPPPKSHKAKHIVALVEKAASQIESKGKAVFPEFRKSGSKWRSGTTYLFVGDMNGVSLFNAGFPKLEGTNVLDLKDSNGKLINQALIQMAQSNGSGWVDYMWPKPGQTKPTQKWSYVKAVKVDGTPAYIGAGFYPK